MLGMSGMASMFHFISFSKSLVILPFNISSKALHDTEIRLWASAYQFALYFVFPLRSMYALSQLRCIIFNVIDV